jgi:hypothetical protein
MSQRTKCTELQYILQTGLLTLGSTQAFVRFLHYLKLFLKIFLTAHITFPTRSIHLYYSIE